MTVIIILIVAGGTAWFILNHRFASTVERKWSGLVFRLAASAHSFEKAEERKLQRLTSDHARDAQAYETAALTDHLRSISIDLLERYPRIGPVTIARLRAVGHHNLASLRGASVLLQTEPDNPASATRTPPSRR